MTEKNPQTIVLDEIRRICDGGRPHSPDSDEGQAVAAAIEACAARPDLAQLATFASQALAMVAAQLEVKPLCGEFAKPHGWPARAGKTTRGGGEPGG